MVFWGFSLRPRLLAFAQSLVQPFPYNVLFSFLSAFSYGPLEVFYMVFLVVGFDQAFKSSSRIISKGVIAASILFGLLHIGNIVFFDFKVVLFNVVKSVLSHLF
ncbi:MAG: hypothetical protein NDF54_00745 [archaeon GB-1867-035]|nr:hypothetical protein [Candidatus Culexmicrobium profundum]